MKYTFTPKNAPTGPRLSDLRTGDTFIHGEVHYIKVNDSGLDNNSFCLGTNLLVTLRGNPVVEKTSHEIRITPIDKT